MKKVIVLIVVSILPLSINFSLSVEVAENYGLSSDCLSPAITITDYALRQALIDQKDMPHTGPIFSMVWFDDMVRGCVQAVRIASTQEKIVETVEELQFDIKESLARTSKEEFQEFLSRAYGQIAPLEKVLNEKGFVVRMYYAYKERVILFSLFRVEQRVVKDATRIIDDIFRNGAPRVYISPAIDVLMVRSVSDVSDSAFVEKLLGWVDNTENVCVDVGAHEELNEIEGLYSNAPIEVEPVWLQDDWILLDAESICAKALRKLSLRGYTIKQGLALQMESTMSHEMHHAVLRKILKKWGLKYRDGRLGEHLALLYEIKANPEMVYYVLSDIILSRSIPERELSEIFLMDLANARKHEKLFNWVANWAVMDFPLFKKDRKALIARCNREYRARMALWMEAVTSRVRMLQTRRIEDNLFHREEATIETSI